MKRSMTLKMGMAAAGIMLVVSAWAQGPGGGPGMGFGDHRPPFERAMGGQGDHGRWWNNPKVIEKLKLTDAQRKAMDDALLQHRETLIDLRGTLEKAELQLEPLMKQDQPNESQVLAQIDKVAQARAELEKANARFLLAVRGKLTPDQWKQMQADRASRQRADWNREDRGPSGPGGRGLRQPGAGRQEPSAPFADGHAAPPPPGGPQGMFDGGQTLDEPPPPQEGEGAGF